MTDILWKDDGISGALDYAGQISWIMFLKFLNDYESAKNDASLITGETYQYILEEKYRWDNWACPKKEDGKLDTINAKNGADLIEFINDDLFTYLKNFKQLHIDNAKSVQYKIGEIFGELQNKVANGNTLREVLDIMDGIHFDNSSEMYQLSLAYESILKNMASGGGNSGEFYTPRALVKAIVEIVAPKVGERVYDPACGTAGFLVEANEYMRKGTLSASDLEKLKTDTFNGIEKTSLSFAMGIMNMILHGVDAPNIYKTNTLTKELSSIEEKDRFEVILANPPFGGQEREQIQNNFPIQAKATELLFLQHMMKSVKIGGRVGLVIPEGVLFQTNNAFKEVKKMLLEDFNLHTILSLPAGIFLPYSGVKTNVIFFDRSSSTSDIWYYEINLEKKLTKNKPIQYEHFKEFLELQPKRELSDNSWIVNKNDIKDFDISAKNPNNSDDFEHTPPLELIENIKVNNQEINNLINEIEDILVGENIE
jgi:type I restriction enzyme M protein